MTKFIQIHFLSSYTGVLLNRDDSGQAKRLPFGGVLRTRVSSQCLKRHWRKAETEFALKNVGPTGERTREVERVLRPLILAKEPDIASDVLDAVLLAIVAMLYGKDNTEKKKRQALLLGRTELEYLAEVGAKLAAEHNSPKAVEKAGAEFLKANKANLSAMREVINFPGGVENALFGRMVTADVAANMDAAVSVAHAFTVHQQESESDYFTVVDDLKSKADGDDGGSGGLFDTEINSGLFYGYVVVDVEQLVANVGGDREIAGKMVESLLHLIATVSPGAKKGSTAPYGYSDVILVEGGNTQPCSLASAFKSPVPLHGASPVLTEAVTRMSKRIERLDTVYGVSAQRSWICLEEGLSLPGADAGSLANLAAKARTMVEAA